MIHIVFQEADIAVLKQAQELDETLAGDVLIVRDDGGKDCWKFLPTTPTS
jgi:hypothetical protein